MKNMGFALFWLGLPLLDAKIRSGRNFEISTQALALSKEDGCLHWIAAESRDVAGFGGFQLAGSQFFSVFFFLGLYWGQWLWNPSPRISQKIGLS